MDDQQISGALSELKQSLLLSGDQYPGEQLRQIVAELESIHNSGGEMERFRELIADLESGIVELEVSNPGLTALVSGIIQSLNAMGI